jgi:ADP-ribose pyrophosphatase
MIPNEELVFSGWTFEIVHKKMEGEGKSFSLEIARRSPGVRLIIIKDGNILLTKEYRFELNGYDYRLPGGKVFDRLSEYRTALEKKESMPDAAMKAAKLECEEETGLVAKSMRHFHTSIAGATVQWDLFYFIVDDFIESKQKLGSTEIIHPEWMPFEKARELCMGGKMSEDRSVGVLLRFLK